MSKGGVVKAAVNRRGDQKFRGIPETVPIPPPSEELDKEMEESVSELVLELLLPEEVLESVDVPTSSPSLKACCSL